MEKNWLIRTIQKQILGPVSKDKVIEFVEKGALKGKDQICSGNGFWFRIEEEELLEQYLFESDQQPFNPVSEAQTVLTDNDGESRENGQTAQTQVIDLNSLNLEKEQAVIPESVDLEYPVENEDPEKTAPKNIKYPSSDDLQYPDLSLARKTGCGELDLSCEDDIAIEKLDKKKS